MEQPELHISISIDDPEIEVWIRDNGNGYPPNFDIENENLGLGTDLILSLTEQIDGKIHCYNDSGANAKIHFINPLME